MKKKVFRVILGIVCLVAIFALSACSAPKGDTVESREALLNKKIEKGKDWTIVKETIIDDHIVSAACSADELTTLAVFQPTSEGGYEVSMSTTLPSYLIMMTSTVVAQEDYDLFWVSDPKAVTLEISYTVDGAALEPLTYDVSSGEIIAVQQEGKEIHITACYYDSAGNRYTHG